MSPLLVALTASVAVILLLSGVGKLRELDDATEAVARFGLPRPWASRPAVAALAASELAAAALVLTAWSWVLPVVWAGVALLFAGFVVLALRVWRRGEVFDCGCFGSFARTQTGGRMVVRNVLLLALAVVALVLSPGATGGLIGMFAAASAAGLGVLVLALVGGVVVALLVSGVRLPRGKGDDVRPIIVIAHLGCGGCEAVLAHLDAHPALLERGRVDLHVRGAEAEIERRYPAVAPYAQAATGSLKQQYAVPAVPAAIRFDDDGERRLALGRSAVLRMLED